MNRDILKGVAIGTILAFAICLLLLGIPQFSTVELTSEAWGDGWVEGYNTAIQQGWGK